MKIESDRDLVDARRALLDWFVSQELSVGDMIIVLGCTAASLLRGSSYPRQACGDFCVKLINHVTSDDEEQEDLRCRPRK
jgi:hypothetical protein